MDVPDITDCQQIREALRASEEKYRLIADNMADTVWVMNMNMRFTYVSPSVTRMYGAAVEDVQGQTIDQSLTPESLQAVVIAFAEEMALEASGTADPARVRVMELEEYKHDRSTFWVESSLSFVRDEDGKPIGILGASRDITGRKRAEAEKEKLEAQNRQLLKAESLGRMAGAIAHHFNNQLQAVMGNLELAMIQVSEDKNPVENLAHAIRSARKASDVIGLMLTYLGQTSGRQETLDISDVCRQTLPLLRSTLPNRTLLDVDLPDPGPLVISNTTDIHQILTHLVTNACESLAGGQGTVHLSVKTVLPENIPVMNRFPVDWKPANPAYACIQITDTGAGISQVDIKKLFDPFFTTKFTGRGLGLSVILGILRAHGGSVVVDSRLGQGSLFSAFLPVSD